MMSNQSLLRLVGLCLVAGVIGCGAPQTPPKESDAALSSGAAATAANIAFADAWIGATPSKAKVAAGYVTLSNPGTENDRLLSASSVRAERVEIHDMRMEAGKMTMRTLETLEIAGGQSVALSPEGMHLMFMNVNTPMLEGESVPVTLVFEKAGAVEAAFAVKAPLTAKAASHDHGAH